MKIPQHIREYVTAELTRDEALAVYAVLVEVDSDPTVGGLLQGFPYRGDTYGVGSPCCFITYAIDDEGEVVLMSVSRYPDLTGTGLILEP